MSTNELDFQQIHADYRPGVQRYLTRLVGEDEAEDLTQEVFLRVSKSLGGFRGDSQLSTWIYRIATNLALDRMRDPAFKRLVACQVPCDADEAAGGAAVFEKAALSPEEQLFRKQRAECYQEYIEALPLNYRAVVVLSELGELAVDEIARLLGMTPGAVKIRLHRGRARLLEALKARCNPDDWL